LATYPYLENELDNRLIIRLVQPYVGSQKNDTNNMRLRKKLLPIFKRKDKSIRKISKEINVPKSTIDHNLMQIKWRQQESGSEFWDKEKGYKYLFILCQENYFKPKLRSCIIEDRERFILGSSTRISMTVNSVRLFSWCSSSEH
jgi:hypothetical protein